MGKIMKRTIGIHSCTFKSTIGLASNLEQNTLKRIYYFVSPYASICDHNA